MSERSLENTLRRLPGVEAARVVTERGAPVEVHVLARPGKQPKQIVRDVQSVALAAHGIRVDRRIVSVVQLEEGDISTGDRPIVEDVAEQIDGSRMSITVTLSWHDEHLIGTATGPASAGTRLRLVADATVAALQQALAEDAAFGIQAVSTPTVGLREVAVAQVVVVVDGAERLMVGSALVNGDPSRAMVRAVLDALNRQVPGLRRTPS